MIGQSSEMGRDIFATSLTRAGFSIASRDFLSGGEIHAAAADTLLQRQLPEHGRPAPANRRWIRTRSVVIVIAFRYRWYVAAAITLFLAAGIFLIASALFTSNHLWLPFVSIEACLLAALPAGLGYRSVEERRLKNAMEAERRQLMGLFERYVSADVAAEIWKNRDQIVLAGEERVTTILFSDIRNFTATTAGVPSKEVLAWLNRYLTAMGEVIKQNRGFLNKFIGDGIMVIFGAPLTEGTQEDACRAVRCAQEMLAAVDQWNATKASHRPAAKNRHRHPHRPSHRRQRRLPRSPRVFRNRRSRKPSLPPRIPNQRLQDLAGPEPRNLRTSPRAIPHSLPGQSPSPRLHHPNSAV